MFLSVITVAFRNHEGVVKTWRSLRNLARDPSLTFEWIVVDGGSNDGTAEFLEKLEDRPLDELYLITPEYLTPYLTYIREHRRVFRATVEQASALRMYDAYAALNRHVLTPILNRFGVPSDDQKYVMQFHISGLMAIINEWLKGDCADSIEHIISVMQLCIKR
mgnify:CR=1 FL=1